MRRHWSWWAGKMCVCFVAAVLSGCSAHAQGTCEGRVDSLLRNALGAGSSDTLYVTRDFHPMLLPGKVFYRTSLGRGFHTVVKYAAVVIDGRDTSLVRRPEDLSILWGRLTTGRQLSAEYAVSLLGELLFQTGQLERGQRFLRAASDLPELTRLSTVEPASLAAIRPPAMQRQGPAVQLVVFALNEAGVSRITATSDGHGTGAIASTLIASLQ